MQLEIIHTVLRHAKIQWIQKIAENSISFTIGFLQILLKTGNNFFWKVGGFCSTMDIIYILCPVRKIGNVWAEDKAVPVVTEIWDIFWQHSQHNFVTVLLSFAHSSMYQTHESGGKITDKRTDVWSRPLCIYTQILSPKKTGFSPIENIFELFFDFCLLLFYATF